LASPHLALIGPIVILYTSTDLRDGFNRQPLIACPIDAQAKPDTTERHDQEQASEAESEEARKAKASPWMGASHTDLKFWPNTLLQFVWVALALPV
jgi:hypothetical protein